MRGRMTVLRNWAAGSGVLMVAIGIVCVLGVETAGSQGTRSATAPPVWSPPSGPSPLREIWSFDTKG